MTPNPIPKALFTLKKHRVKSLLISGQDIIYGSAEFSRDSDLVALSNQINLNHLHAALGELKAELIYVLPLAVEYLECGHGCYFRCQANGVENLCVDIMAKLKVCASFFRLWARENTIKLKDGSVNVKQIYEEEIIERKKDAECWEPLKKELEILRHGSWNN